MEKHWLLVHTHRHGTSIYVLTHPTLPDFATVEAWAIRMCGYEPDREDELLELEGVEITPFVDLVAQLETLHAAEED